MSLLRLVLAIYFAVLSVMPCEDVQKQSGSEAQLIFASSESHSKDKTDICSPLCVCNCCQITIATFKMDAVVNVPKQIRTYFSKKILFHKKNFAYQVYDHIWQPPKI